MRSGLWATGLLAIAVFGLCSITHAQTVELPHSLAAEALSELRPTAFAPVDLDVTDYTVSLVPAAAAPSRGVSVRLAAGSLDWVRIAKTLLVPRAVLEVRVAGIRAGQVRYAGFAHPIVVQEGLGSAAVPIVLLPAGSETIEIETDGASGRELSRIAVKFTPRAGHTGRVLFDSSCSPSRLQVQGGNLPDDAMLYVGCRQVRSVYGDRAEATLELQAVMLGRGGDVAIDGTPTRSTPPELVSVRVGPSPGSVEFELEGHRLMLGYSAPPHLSSAFLGLGLGPYLFHYEDSASHGDTFVPVLTLYAGYSFNAATRVVYFNAVVPDRHGSIDQGLYLWLEQARFLDERMSFNLLLGGNVLVYRHEQTQSARISVPQGFELALRDLFTPRTNATLGAFLYPAFQGRSYYNVWLRLSTPDLFGELNYIEWQETRGSDVTRSRVLGLSFGVPLLRFL